MAAKRVKKWHIALIVIASIIAVIGIIVLGTSLYAIRIDDNSAPNAGLSEWMDCIEDGTLLKKVAIPGAHDAGTAGMLYVAKTQDRTTAELLSCGTRYLDIRVTKKNDDYKIYHGPISGASYTSVLNDIKTFISAHPTETVILDLQHFGDGAKGGAITLTEEYLAPFFLKKDTEKTEIEFIDGLTLGECRGKVIVFVGEDDGTYVNRDVFFSRGNDDGTKPGATLHSYYDSSYNKSSAKKYVEEYVGTYLDRYVALDSGLFVLQGQLTDGLLVLGPKFRESQNIDGMNAYVAALSDSAKLNYVNIVLRDFITPKKNAITLKLNLFKSIVKSDKIEFFSQLIS